MYTLCHVFGLLDSLGSCSLCSFVHCVGSEDSVLMLPWTGTFYTKQRLRAGPRTEAHAAKPWHNYSTVCVFTECNIGHHKSFSRGRTSSVGVGFPSGKVPALCRATRGSTGDSMPLLAAVVQPCCVASRVLSGLYLLHPNVEDASVRIVQLVEWI